ITQVVKGTTGDKTFYAKWDSTYPVTDTASVDLMVKFGVKSAGYALNSISNQDVTATFNKVKAYMATMSASKVNPTGGLGAIKLGDYVELPSLIVSAYNGNGAVNITSNANDGKLRLMVVGINPYYGKNGNTVTPHLVFQFKEYPGNGRMHASNSADNTGGYKISEMRSYLLTNYWPALKTAGVPDSAVWAVKRMGANDGNATAVDTIEDKLWLPTEREMFGNNSESNSAYETATNQGRLGYYNDANSRKKANAYLTASPARESYWWCGIASDGQPTRWIHPSTSAGVAPAFAVSGADQPPAATKTVTYNANGGSGDAPAQQTIITGGGVTAPAAGNLTKANYLFGGWNTLANGNGSNYDAGATINSVTSDITLYAKWGVDLIYSANGGIGTPPAKVSSQTATTVTIAGGTGLYKADITVDGYTRYLPFVGWSTQPDGSGTTYAEGTSYTLNTVVTLYAKYGGNADLMVTFNIKNLDYPLSGITAQQVTATFNAISTHIKTKSASNVNYSDGLGAIKMGDYINLGSLNVAAYNNNAAVILANTDAGNDKLRLMVVGLNSYYDKNGNGTSTPHIIFHFKDFPGNTRMNASNTNAGGYLGSEMRTYLTSKYWPALQTAGVPESVVWPVSRRGANGGNADTIEDKLWLPTVREMKPGRNPIWQSGNSSETDANQGKLGYYASNSLRKSDRYWTATPYEQISFVSITTGEEYKYASEIAGCAPAFAVK
ncbi:MAG: InlB B-repeat-containing protein, partial [Spirochaetaceae bacterium]|nr:InlB B-repeat-containing protein [Spirochaetaceae bacterium]